MPALPTVLLLHATAHDTHHDWCIAFPPSHRPASDPPDSPDAPALWTARVGPPSRHWAALGRFLLTPLPPHRRHYLTYQGPISGGRGTVRRIDLGHILPLRWTDTHLLLNVQFRHFHGLIDLRLLCPTHWQATVSTPAARDH